MLSQAVSEEVAGRGRTEIEKPASGERVHCAGTLAQTFFLPKCTQI